MSVTTFSYQVDAKGTKSLLLADEKKPARAEALRV
jgi:hypothetical protein